MYVNQFKQVNEWMKVRDLFRTTYKYIQLSFHSSNFLSREVLKWYKGTKNTHIGNRRLCHKFNYTATFSASKSVYTSCCQLIRESSNNLQQWQQTPTNANKFSFLIDFISVKVIFTIQTTKSMNLKSVKIPS